MFGDVSEEDKAMAVKLADHERLVDLDKTMSNDIKAYSFVCLAHDWYAMGMEEEGHQLLSKADAICPGYFENVMVKHTRENRNFELVVRNISVELMWMVIEQIRERNK